MLLVEHHDVIQALSSHRADQPLHMRILLGRPWGGEHLPDAEVADALAEVRAIDAISVLQEVMRHSLFREVLHDLLGDPLGTGTRSQFDVNNPATIM